MACASFSIWVSSVSVQPPCNRRLAAPNALVAPRANVPASRAASTCNSASGTTRFTSPHASASAADSRRLVSASSSARFMPTVRGRK